MEGQVVGQQDSSLSPPDPKPQQTVEGTEQHPVIVGEQAMPELLQGGPVWLSWELQVFPKPALPYGEQAIKLFKCQWARDSPFSGSMSRSTPCKNSPNCSASPEM